MSPANIRLVRNPFGAMDPLSWAWYVVGERGGRLELLSGSFPTRERAQAALEDGRVARWQAREGRADQ